MQRSYNARWQLALALIVAGLLLPTLAFSADFSVELLKPMQGLRQCQVMFTNVPPKKKVDLVMEAALKLCVMADDSYDVQTMAFKGDDTLDETEETYTYLVYDHRKHSTKRVTFGEFLKGLKPIR